MFWKHAVVKYRAGVETLALICLALIGARSHNVTSAQNRCERGSTEPNFTRTMVVKVRFRLDFLVFCMDGIPSPWCVEIDCGTYEALVIEFAGKGFDYPITLPYRIRIPHSWGR